MRFILILKFYFYLITVVLLTTIILHAAMSYEKDKSESYVTKVGEKTILVLGLELSKKEIEKLENDLKNNYCKERGCEVDQHLKAINILILRFNNLKSQRDEAKYLNSVLPEGVVAAGDQVVSRV